MTQPPFQPPPGEQPQQPPQPEPAPDMSSYKMTTIREGAPLRPPGPPKRKRFGWIALLITGLVVLFLGIGVGAAGDGGGSTAAPAPTVTVTETPPVVEGGQDNPTAEPTQAPTKAPAKWNPSPKDFKVTIKVTDKQCFGSAGCNVSYKVGLDYLGSQKVPSKGTTDITYEVSGAEDKIIGTITLNSDGKFDVVENSTSTRSSSSKLVAKVTEVDYNELG